MSETLTGYSPPQTPENSAITSGDNQAFERRYQLRTWNSLRTGYTDLPPEDRFSLSTGAQEVKKESHIDPEKYLATVARLQSHFDRSLGIRVGTIRNYNPVLARAMFKQLQTEEERAQFKQYEIKQIETALRERYHAALSVVIYDIDESGKLRSRDLPNQAFEDVLTVGIEYYKQLGSPDVERMQQERAGILKIQEVFVDPNASANLKAEVVSGPGLVENTIFTDNFLDRYEFLEEPLTRRRIVQMTRFASAATYEQYEERITSSRPDYFEGAVEPKDQRLLANPIFENSDEIFNKIFIKRKKALKEKDFQKIVQESSNRMRYLVDTICESIFDPQKVAIALNAVLNGADYIWERIAGIKERILGEVSKVANKIMPIFKTIAEEVNWLGHQAVRAVAAECGLSCGFSIGGVFSKIASFISGAVRGIGTILGFGESDQYGSLEFDCPGCHQTNRRPKGQLIPNCQHCGKDVRC